MTVAPRVKRAFVQAAYFVEDAAAAAAHFATNFGAGPFFLFEHIPLERVVYRGTPATLDHTSAYGQLGPIMVELVQQHGEYASVFRDLYPRGQTGLHHMAYFADDLAVELARLEAQGYPTAMTAETATGVRFAFADARKDLGHMLEIYQQDATLRGFYAMVRSAAEDWNGRDPVRALG